MKILYFYQYFSTPNGSWGTRVYDFAKEWVEQGHEVTVVTSVYTKSDLKPTKFFERLNYDGIEVLVLNISIDNRQSILRRIYTFVFYAVLSVWFALRIKNDVTISSSGPITVGIPGLAAKWIRGRKLVFEARDIWPEGAIEMGVIKNFLLKKIAYWFEKVCYINSDCIIALSPGMQQDILSRYPNLNVHSVTNAANIELFSTPVTFSLKEGLQSYKYAIYTGNIGAVNNSLILLETARVLKNKGRTDLKLLVIGQGQQRDHIQQRIADENLQDVFILWDLMPKDEIVGYIQSSLVSLVPLLNKPILNTSSPNKFFESLAAGVPVVQNTKGWMKTFLDREKVGYTVEANDPLMIANLMIQLDADSEGQKTIREHCKVVASSNFDKTYLASEMLKHITAALI